MEIPQPHLLQFLHFPWFKVFPSIQMEPVCAYLLLPCPMDTTEKTLALYVHLQTLVYIDKILLGAVSSLG